MDPFVQLVSALMGQEGFIIKILQHSSNWNAKGPIVTLNLAATSAGLHFLKAQTGSDFSFAFWQKEKAKCKMRTLTLHVQHLLEELERGCLQDPTTCWGKPGSDYGGLPLRGIWSMVCINLPIFIRFSPLSPTEMGTSPTDLTWTVLGRCRLLWTTVCSSTSGLCFPVSRLPCCRWPKLSLSIFSCLQMVRSDTGRCVWAANCPVTGHKPSATTRGSSFHPSPQVRPTQSRHRVWPSMPHIPGSVNPRDDNQVTLQFISTLSVGIFCHGGAGNLLQGRCPQ